MIILIKLLLAHFIGYFVLQPSAWVIDKEVRKIKTVKLYQHIAFHGLLAAALIADFKAWPLVLLLMLFMEQ